MHTLNIYTVILAECRYLEWKDVILLQMAENLFIIWLLDQMWSWNKKLTVARGRDNVGQHSDGFTIG